MLFNNLNISSMNVLEKTNTFVKKGADQCANIAGRVKTEAPGFFKGLWEATKKNKEAAIAATVLTGAALIAYKMGKSKGRRQRK
jgi:ABC-type cobalt transport system substrate-binding protein